MGKVPVVMTVLMVMMVRRAVCGDALSLVVHPSGEWKVPEDTNHNITLHFTVNSTRMREVLEEALERTQEEDEAVLEVMALHRDIWRLNWKERTARFTTNDLLNGVNKTLTFSGFYWGRTHVGFFLTRNDLELDTQGRWDALWDLYDPWKGLNLSIISPGTSNLTHTPLDRMTNLTLLNDIQIVVDRSAHVIEGVFIGLGSIFLLMNNINMGAQLDLNIIREVLGRPLGPLCGFISQFTFMPLITFAMGYFFFTDPLYRLGLFTLGCSPGGMMSNFWTLMFGGDINLSITMTAVSTVAAMAMMPFWMFTLGQSVTQGASMQVPYGNLVLSLISLTLPIGIGLAIRRWKPVWADRGAKIIKPFTVVVIMSFMGFWFYSSYKIFAMMSWQMAVAGFLVAGLGFGCGATLATLFCLPRKQIIAICIETAFQNGGVVFILLKLSLPSPDSDLAALPAMATMLLTGPPMLICNSIYVLARRYCGCCPQVEEEKLKKEKEDQQKLDEEKAKGEIETFLSDKNIFTDSVMKENESRFGLVLQGMTKLKLASGMKETDLL